MASPTVAQRTESSTTSAATTAAVGFTQTTGDLVILLISTAVSTSVSNNKTFTNLTNNTATTHVLYKQLDGSEGGTVTLTVTSSKVAVIAYNVQGAMNPATQAPQLSTVATATSVNPNATTVTPTGGAKDYLWITWFGQAGEEADDDTWTTATPGSFTNLVQKTTGTTGLATVNTQIASAEFASNAASMDAGSFTTAQSLLWRAYTVAVHPGPQTLTKAQSETSVVQITPTRAQSETAVVLKATTRGQSADAFVLKTTTAMQSADAIITGTGGGPIVITNRDSGTGTSNPTSTTSFAFQNGTLYLLSVLTAGAGSNSSTVTGGGITWTKVQGTAAGSESAAIFTGYVDSGASTGALSITGTGTVSRIAWSLDSVAGSSANSATNGANAIVQSNVQARTTSATSTSITLSAFADATNNAAFGFTYVHLTAVTIAIDPTTGPTWTLLQNWTSAISHMTQWHLGQDTTVTSSWTGANTAMAVAAEIAVATGGASTVTKDQAATAVVQITPTRAQSGTAVVLATLTRTQTSTAVVLKTATKVQTATAIVAKTTTRPQTSTAIVLATLTKAQGATAVVLKTTTKAQSMTAVVATTSTLTRAQSETAVVLKTTTRTQSADAVVLADVIVTNVDAGAQDNAVSDGQTQATASIAFQNDRLYIVTVSMRGTSPMDISGITGGGITWAKTTTSRTGANLMNVAQYWGLTTSGASTGALTMTFAGGSTSTMKWVVDEFRNVDTGSPIVQTAAFVGGSNSNTGTVTLGAFADATRNVAYGVFSHNVTEDTVVDASGGWTQLADEQTVTAGTQTIFSEWKKGQDTSVTATWASTTNLWAGVATEVKAATAAPSAQTRSQSADAIVQAITSTQLGVNDTHIDAFAAALGAPLVWDRIFYTTTPTWSDANYAALITAGNKGYQLIPSTKLSGGMTYASIAAGTNDAAWNAIFDGIHGHGFQNGIFTFQHEPENDGGMPAAHADWQAAQSHLADLLHAHVLATGDGWRWGTILMNWTFNPSSGRDPEDWWVPEADIYLLDPYNALDAVDGSAGTQWCTTNPALTSVYSILGYEADYYNSGGPHGAQPWALSEFSCARRSSSTAERAQWLANVVADGVLEAAEFICWFEMDWASDGKANWAIRSEPDSLAQLRLMAGFPSRDQSADAVVLKTLTKVQAATAVVQVTPTKAQSAGAVVLKTTTKTQGADAYVTVTGTPTRTQSETAVVLKTLTRVQSSSAVVQITPTRAQSATAVVPTTATRAQTATAVVLKALTKVQGADAVVTALGTLTRAQSETAVVLAVLTRAQSATAIVRSTLTKAQGSTAVVRATSTRAQSATALVATQRTRAQSSTAFVVAVLTRAQAATAVVRGTLAATQATTAVVQKGDIVRLSGDGPVAGGAPSGDVGHESTDGPIAGGAPSGTIDVQSKDGS